MTKTKTKRKHKAVRRFNKLATKVAMKFKDACDNDGKAVPKRHKFPRGVDLSITYVGGLDRDRDRAVREILGEYGTGSGFSFVDGTRDISATVPIDDLPRVVRALKKIQEIEIKKCVIEWVTV